MRSQISRTVLEHQAFAGIHFTGSTTVFQTLWKTIGDNLERYRTYPRIVGETGGKDFVVAHASADVDALAVALVRGAYRVPGTEVQRGLARVHSRTRSGPPSATASSP